MSLYFDPYLIDLSVEDIVVILFRKLIYLVLWNGNLIRSSLAALVIPKFNYTEFSFKFNTMFMSGRKRSRIIINSLCSIIWELSWERKYGRISRRFLYGFRFRIAFISRCLLLFILLFNKAEERMPFKRAFKRKRSRQNKPECVFDSTILVSPSLTATRAD